MEWKCFGWGCIWAVEKIRGGEAIELLACAESSAFLGIHFCVTPRSLLYGEFENPTPPPLQLPKIEAIQTSLFVDVPDVLATVFIRNASTPKSKSTSRWPPHPLYMTPSPSLEHPEDSIRTESLNRVKFLISYLQFSFQSFDISLKNVAWMLEVLPRISITFASFNSVMKKVIKGAFKMGPYLVKMSTNPGL